MVITDPLTDSSDLVQKYTQKYVPKDEDKNELKELFTKLKSFENEKAMKSELKSSNAYNRNGIVNKLKDYKRWIYMLEKAKEQLSKLDRKKKKVDAIVSLLVLIQTQEQNFKSLCNFSSLLSSFKFTEEPKSNVYLIDKSNEKVLFTLEDMDKTLKHMYANICAPLDQDWEVVDAFVRHSEHVIQTLKHNLTLIRNYGIKKKYIDANKFPDTNGVADSKTSSLKPQTKPDKHETTPKA